MKTHFQHAWAEILAFLAIFFADLLGALVAVGFLILSDTFTGIWAAWKKGGRESVTSGKMGRILSKLILYPLAIIVAKVAQDYLAPEIPWIKVTAGILAVVEVKSIFENISKVLGFDLWHKIKEQLSRSIKNE